MRRLLATHLPFIKGKQISSTRAMRVRVHPSARPSDNSSPSSSRSPRGQGTTSDRHGQEKNQKKSVSALPDKCRSAARRSLPGGWLATLTKAVGVGQSPGLIWTDIWRGLGGSLQGDDAPEVIERRKMFDTMIEPRCPLRREQTPEDIGKAVVFLASDDARNITGQALNVDGGIVMN